MHIYSITVLKYNFEFQYLYILLFYYILETEIFYSITLHYLISYFADAVSEQTKKTTNANNRENAEY